MDGSGMRVRADTQAHLFNDRQDMKEVYDNNKIEKHLEKLFAERMKHNKEVFKADILDEDKSKKK